MVRFGSFEFLAIKSGRFYSNLTRVFLKRQKHKHVNCFVEQYIVLGRLSFLKTGGKIMGLLTSEQAVIAILANIFFIGISFYALQALMVDKFIKKNHVFQAQLFFILVSIMLGSTVANFFLNLTSWSNQLQYLF